VNISTGEMLNLTVTLIVLAVSLGSAFMTLRVRTAVSELKLWVYEHFEPQRKPVVKVYSEALADPQKDVHHAQRI
jgi:hypothetical protein